MVVSESLPVFFDFAGVEPWSLAALVGDDLPVVFFFVAFFAADFVRALLVATLFFLVVVFLVGFFFATVFVLVFFLAAAFFVTFFLVGVFLVGVFLAAFLVTRFFAAVALLETFRFAAVPRLPLVLRAGVFFRTDPAFDLVYFLATLNSLPDISD